MTITSAPISFTKPWQEAWPDLAERAVAYDALRALGCDTFAARAWMATPVGVAYERADDLLEIVTPWVRSGLSTHDAIAWADTLVFDPADAWTWHTAGFTPKQAMFVHDVLSCGSPLPTVEVVLHEEAQWVASGLLPQDVLLGVAAGLSVAATVRRVLRRGLASADAGMMRMYAGLRGFDVQSLSVDHN